MLTILCQCFAIMGVALDSVDGSRVLVGLCTTSSVTVQEHYMILGSNKPAVVVETVPWTRQENTT